MIDRKIDFAFRLGELKSSQLRAIPIGMLEVMFCASPQYLVENRRIRFADMIKDGHLLIPSFITAASMSKLVDLDENGITHKAAACHTSTDGYTLDLMAKAGMGVTPTFDLTVLEAIEKGELKSILRSHKIPRTKVNLVYHRREHLPEHKKCFKDFMKVEFQAMMKSIPKL